MSLFQSLVDRTEAARARCSAPLTDLRLQLHIPKPDSALAALATVSPALGALLSDYWRLGRDDAGSGYCQRRVIGLRIEPLLDARLRDCGERLGSRDPAAGYIGFLFSIESLRLIRRDPGESDASLTLALARLIETAGDGPARCDMIEAYAFFVFDLLSATIAGLQDRHAFGDAVRLRH